MLYPIIKRAFDVVFASLGLLLLLPSLVLVSLLIKLFDPGPILYRQTRVGRYGRLFQIWKFRTMAVNENDNGALVTQENDPRITRLGRILRRTKIDELPQLWNVLKGEMSFVGPRPQVPRYINPLTPKEREMLQYKPGITDLASLMFKNEQELLSGTVNVEDFYMRYCQPKKIALNLQYGRLASFHHDVWIIFKTICPRWFGASVVHLLCLVVGLWLAYALRVDFQTDLGDYEEFKRILPWMVLPQLILLTCLGQLRGVLSYFSIPEMRRTIFALGAALVFQLGLQFSLQGDLVPSRSILFLDFLLTFFALCTARMGLRLLRERFSQPKPKRPAPVRRVAIIGTGELATNLALDFVRSQNPVRRVVAFFDDDPHTWQKRPHDIPVVGMPECLLAKERQKQIDEVIVTLPEENSVRIQEIREMLKSAPFKVIIASGWPELNGNGSVQTELEFADSSSFRRTPTAQPGELVATRLSR